MFENYRFTRRMTILPLCVGTLFLIGCGGGDSGGKSNLPPLGKVNGIIKLDGKALENAFVEYMPADASASRGKTDSSGAYTLDFNATTKGATLGEHAVRITTKPGAALGAGIVEKVPPQYNVKSQLKATVKAGDNKVDFDLTSK